MALRVLIVEDEWIVAEHLTVLLQRLGYDVLSVADTAEEALALLAEGPLPDVVLLDIRLRGPLDGIDLANRLRATYPVPFLFLTSHADSVTLARVKQVQPYGYLVKPFESAGLFAVIELAVANFRTERAAPLPVPPPPPDSLFVREGRQWVRVRLADIRWLEADGNYTRIHTLRGRHLALGSLKEFEERLPAPAFLRVHKSYVVAVAHLTAVEALHVVLGPDRLPIGRVHQAEVLRHLHKIGML